MVCKARPTRRFLAAAARTGAMPFDPTFAGLRSHTQALLALLDDDLSPLHHLLAHPLLILTHHLLKRDWIRRYRAPLRGGRPSYDWRSRLRVLDRRRLSKHCVGPHGLLSLK